MEKGMFSHYDHKIIARHCENVSLFNRALELVTDAQDIKRLMLKYLASPNVDPEFFTGYFKRLSIKNSMDCLRMLLQNRGSIPLVHLANAQQTTLPQLVAQVASKYTEHMTSEALIKLFEEEKCYDGLYFYLGQIVNFSKEASVHNMYIEAATKVGDMNEVERIVSQSKFFDPERIRDHLMEASLTEQQQGPLITVCDRFGFVEELTRFFYEHNMNQNIEIYVQQINPMNTPQVIGALLDLDCNEELVFLCIVCVCCVCMRERVCV
jgi:clathrin heavy chain